MGYMPENTLASYERAIAEGVDEVELDIRLSKDGEMVIMHDATVDRTTDGHGLVAEMTLAELRTLDAGAGQRIPTFCEALETITVKTLAEVKAPEVVEQLLALLADRPDIRERIDVISFDEAVVKAVSDAFPGVRTALLSQSGSEEFVDRAADLGAAWVGVGWEGSTPELIEYAHARGLEYSLWPAESIAEFDRAMELGADGVTTNYPALIKQRSLGAVHS